MQTLNELALKPISNAAAETLAKHSTLIDPNSCILCGDPSYVVGVFVEESAVREQRNIDKTCITYGLCPYCFLLPDKDSRVEERLGVSD